MNNILVPLGTSDKAINTLMYAIDFAKDFGASVYVIDVFTVIPTASTLANVEEKIVNSSMSQLRELINRVDTKGVPVKLATYNGDIIDGLKELDKELGIDLILIAPRSNDINEALYLGSTTGRIVKQTNIPTLVVPKESSYQGYHKILVAFRSGVLNRRSILNPLFRIKEKCKPDIDLLLVKTPNYKEEDLSINTSLLDITKNVTITQNTTTYMGVLEHFQEKSPDLLVVFRRRRGFFKKLWERSTILKSEFFVPIPLLILSVKKD